jgi:hypothetical protein
MPRPPAARTALAAALIAALASGCTSDSPPPAADAAPRSATDSATPGAPDTAAAGTPDTAAPMPDAAPSTCAEAEVCIFACMGDASCEQGCHAKLPSQAQTLFTAMVSCRTSHCADPSDFTCRCETECYSDGACNDAHEACMDGLTDPWCEMLCH